MKREMEREGDSVGEGGTRRSGRGFRGVKRRRGRGRKGKIGATRRPRERERES